MNTAILSAEIQSQRAVSNIERLGIALWAAALGIVSGLACVGVRLGFRGLQWIFVQHIGLLPQAAAALHPARRIGTPVAGALCALAVLWAVRRWTAAEPSTEYVEAVRFDEGRIPFTSTLWRTVASAFSVSTGAAIGREGSMIQFAAAVTSWMGARSPLRSIPLSRQVAYGAAAAVAAAYQAPLAGLFFALEIVLGEWLWAEIPLLALASTAGWLVSRTVLGAGPLFAVHVAIPLSRAALWTLPLAALLGVCGPLYQKLLRSMRFMGKWPLALLWSGLAVGLLSLCRPEVWGNGDKALLNMLGGTVALGGIALILALRLIATTLCVGTGTVGGVFTPTLFAGAAVGLALGQLLHAPAPVLLAVAGLSAFLSAVTHAPIMAALMAAELTGEYHLLPLLLVLNLIAWQIALRLSRHSLYAIATPDPAPREAES